MECEERIESIIDGFQKNRKAFTAIGDETRQIILLACAFGEQFIRHKSWTDCRKNASDKAFRVTSSSNSEGSGDCGNAQGRNKKLLLSECG